MIKVFENFDYTRVGQMQSLLESHGISTFLKNQFASSVMGEVPFVEVCPQLYVLRDADLEKALRLLRLAHPDTGHREAWVCPSCGVEIEAQFRSCWNCAREIDQ